MAKPKIDKFLAAAKKPEREHALELLNGRTTNQDVADFFKVSEAAVRRWRTANEWDPADEPPEVDFGRQLAEVRQLANARKTEIGALRKSEEAAWDEVASLEERHAEAWALREGDTIIPDWVAPITVPKAHIARPVLFLSDLHLDEIVEARVMNGMNSYNRDIANDRFQRVINMTVDLLNTYTAGLDFDGITVPLGGDIFTGTIHEELAETNHCPMPESVRYWVGEFASALEHLADEFGRVHVPCVDGNHDRTGKKKRNKLRAEDSWAWVFYHWLADVLKDDDRIDFTISPASEIIFPVFGTKFLLNHGDETNGGQGIGGIYPPIKRWAAKAMEVYASQGQTYDYAIIGHWHQMIYGQGLIVNGSLKGYDEYAKGKKFAFEPPQQALFLVTPERGLTMPNKIFADDTIRGAA